MKIHLFRCVHVLASFIFPFAINGQILNGERIPSTQAPTVQAAKDGRAISALVRLVAASGWTKTAIPLDAVVTGTITRYLKDSSPSSTFTIKLRGQDQYQYSEDGSVHMVTNGPAGASMNRDGKAQRLPPHTAFGSRGVVLPMFSVMPDWSSPDVDVTFVGPSSVQGEVVVVVQLTRRYPASDRLARMRQPTAPIVFWISTTRNLPLRADYSLAAVDNYHATVRETVLFSDYQTVNGMAVPFRQDVFLGDQRLKTLQFSTVRFNIGLTDADFSVPATTAGGAR
jgi:hypothetical protein